MEFDAQTLRSLIEQNTLSTLPPYDFSIEQLSEMFRISQLFPGSDTQSEYPLDDDPTIPQAQLRLRDPRLRSRSQRKQWLQAHTISKVLVQYPILGTRKLKIVLDLDLTLIQCIKPQYSNNKSFVESEILKIMRGTATQPKLLSLDVPEFGTLYYIITVRPNLEKFLKQLLKFADLYIYTAAEYNYTHKILKILDPTNRFFQFSHVYTTPQGARAGSTQEKRLQNLFGDRLEEYREDILILDDQIDVWCAEDQPHVVPSMRYAPLYRYNTDSNDTQGKLSNISTYIYKKGLIGYPDESMLHMDETGHQFKPLYDLFQDIFIHRYINCNAQTASEIYEQKRMQILAGEQVFLGMVGEPYREQKVAAYEHIVEVMGGTIAESSTKAKVIVEEQTMAPPGGIAKPGRWLTEAFFCFNKSN